MFQAGIIAAIVFLQAVPRKDQVLKLTVRPKFEKAVGHPIRIDGFCATNPKP